MHFYPVKVTFVGQGSVAAVKIAAVTRVQGGDEVTFSEDSVLVVDGYTVV